MSTRKVSVDEQKRLIPNRSIRDAFMERPDISVLPEPEREQRWQAHQKHVDHFRTFLSRCDAVVVKT